MTKFAGQEGVWTFANPVLLESRSWKLQLEIQRACVGGIKNHKGALTIMYGQPAFSCKCLRGGNMRLLLMVWAVIELLQLVLIGMLWSGCRKLQRQVDGDYRFSTYPPPSVTDE